MDPHLEETIREFMESPLVQWVWLFQTMMDAVDDVDEVDPQGPKVRYLQLTNGIFLNHVMRIIDPNVKVEHLYDGDSDDLMLRVQNFSILNRHIRAFYQEDLQQLILMPLPNVAILGQDPLTDAAVEEVRRLLLLLLGCAVQSERKETFIQQIQSLDIETQADIACCIQQVTLDRGVVLPLQWEELMEVEGSDLQVVFVSMVKHIQSLSAQRDSHLERIMELCRERETHSDLTLTPVSEDPPQGLTLQLANNKAQLRRLKQQLEDKGDQILDYKQEIQTMEEHFKKLLKENRALQGEVRGIRVLRDELDCVRERASRSEQIQNELQTCRQRLRMMEHTRTQLKEQQQLCAALQETKTLLEEQLRDARGRCSVLRELERDNLSLRQRLIDVETERDTERQRVDELLELNLNLETDLRENCHRNNVEPFHHRFLQSEYDSDEELEHLIGQKPLSQEFGEASTLRLLGAEQENAELRRRLQDLQAQQEDESPDSKNDLICLEMEHQHTVKECHNLKNENATLKQLLSKLQILEDDEKEEQDKEEIRVNQDTGSYRGDGVGRVRNIQQKDKGDVIGTQREAGVGEEVLLRTRDEVNEMKKKKKKRGEAEGGQKEKMRSDEAQEHPLEDGADPTDQDPSVGSISDVDHVTKHLQEDQDEEHRQVLLSNLEEHRRRAREAEQKVLLLEVQVHNMKRSAEKMEKVTRQMEVLKSDSLTLEEELSRLRAQEEIHRMQTNVIASLEGERAALERDRDTLRNNMDALRSAQRKTEHLELTTQTLRAELERQSRSLETSRRRHEELEAEVREAAVESASLCRTRDQAVMEATRLEQEKEACQCELDGQRKDNRQRDREAVRLKQQLESTNLALERSNQRTRTLEAEHRRVCQQLCELQEQEKEVRSELFNMEEKKDHLEEKHTHLQSEISSLTQDLSSEQRRSLNLSAEVERLSQKLENAEVELKTASDALLQCQERITLLNSEGFPLDEDKRRKAAETERFRVRGRPEDEEDDVRLTPAQTDTDTDRALKEGAVVVPCVTTRCSEEEIQHLKDHLEALRRNSFSLQDSCTQLHTLNTQLQVEQASLGSQHAVLMARCSESEARCAALEAEAKVMLWEREESLTRTGVLRRDHDRMRALQQRQEAELEELLEKHSKLRRTHRSLEGQHRDLEARYQELLDGKSQVEEREEELRSERERMEGDAHRRMERERDLERMRDEHQRLQAQQKDWCVTQAELLTQGSVLRVELSASQLERTRLEGELSSLRETNQNLDVSSARLTSQYQLLTQLKGNMEEENRHLAEQNQSLLKENRALLEQSLERRDLHYSQQKEYQEKLSELRREKQKLVEKIMDQYRILDPSMQPSPSKAKKSNWIADRMKKLIKPRREGRDGRIQYTAAGSVENLADSSDFTLDSHTPDPRSAPASPSASRKAPSQVDQDPSAPGTRSGSRSRRKLGSRHGLGLGLSRGGSGVSQSFSPGDHKTTPRPRIRSGQNPSSVPWEGQRSKTNAPQVSSSARDEKMEEIERSKTNAPQVSSSARDEKMEEIERSETNAPQVSSSARDEKMEEIERSKTNAPQVSSSARDEKMEEGGDTDHQPSSVNILTQQQQQQQQQQEQQQQQQLTGLE